MVYNKVMNEKSGLILIVVLWILLILTIFALGTARKTSLDLLLSGYKVDKLKSYYAAKAAVAYAKSQLTKDAHDNQTRDFDYFYKCGVSLDQGKSPEDLFGDVKVGEGSFTISYNLIENGNSQKIFGFEDEQARINLNGINAQNYNILVSLMNLLGVEPDTALTIASSVVDWRDSDSNVINPPSGAEESFYASLEPTYHCQNSNFRSPEELMLVRGMNKEIFKKIKDFVTVFPVDTTKLQVNVNTASSTVLQALANSSVDNSISGRNQSDADNLVQNIIDYRRGDDNIIATADDRLVEQNKLDEWGLFADLSKFFIYKSDYFRINAEGLYKDKKVKSRIVAVLQRGNDAPLFWHED